MGNIIHQNVYIYVLKRMASQIIYISDRGLFGLIITDPYYSYKRRQSHLQLFRSGRLRGAQTVDFSDFLVLNTRTFTFTDWSLYVQTAGFLNKLL